MKKLLLLSIAIVFAVAAQAQKGNVALGLRFSPDGAGFSGKFFLDRNWAIEAQANAGGIFALEGESFNVVGLAEYHYYLPDPAWRLFFGGGIHFGAWDRDHDHHDHDHDHGNAIFGIDGIFGAEYVFKNIPLGLSADIKPAVNFVSDVDFFPHNMLGFGARFYLGR